MHEKSRIMLLQNVKNHFWSKQDLKQDAIRHPKPDSRKNLRIIK